MKLSHLFLPSLLALANALPTYAESGRDDYDLDDNGLIEINDLADLNEIRNNLDGTTLYGKSDGCPPEGCEGFELTTDLDFDTNGDGVMDENDDYWNNGEGWEPIGNYIYGDSDSEEPFTAVFNGNDYKILNLYIHCSTSDEYQHALFGFIRNAEMSNLELSGELMSINCSLAEGSTGALIGFAEASEIHHINSTGTVRGGTGATGGVVGRALDNSLISYLSSSGDISGVAYAGGIIGHCRYCSLTSSQSQGNITGIGPEGRYLGGLIGSTLYASVTLSHSSADVKGYGALGGLIGNSDYSTIAQSYATGNIVASFRYSGGLVGRLRTGSSISNSYATGNVLAESEYAGGLIGDSKEGSSIENSYAIGSVSGGNYIGGVAGYVEESSSISNSYWATDTSGQTDIFGDDDTTTVLTDNAGVSLADLWCPISSDDAECLLNTTLFKGWDDTYFNDQGEVAVWDFGTSSQLPALNINGEVYRDSDLDGVEDRFDDYPNDPERSHKSSSSSGGSLFWLVGLTPFALMRKRKVLKAL